MPTTVDVIVEVDGADLDDGERIDLGRQLEGELRMVDGADVEPAATDRPPSHAKAGEALTAGALVVSLAPAAFAQMMQIVAVWLGRQRVGIKIALDGQTLEGDVTQEQRDALVEAFLARTAGKKRK